ncbi:MULTISPECIES: DUF4332 domain-containing protein [Anaerolinea]|uniref:DUF4332 domain-containing protein n=1 Tax=Anaerolinea thermophila (strain DSM 14523 / JCM 11388 / NBRC 100420 / UNI-1) TaxID=926569 RepID=E8N648_ANATU|nr:MULTISPECIES: DUF4332 domain-containing protein [Anaerolinea]BAJ63912.1 hypothetical protein ANT_18860 [Anaerolinea thermophila UNI-1]
MTALVDIEGIGEVYAEKLKAAGISSVEKLLEAGSTPKGREDLAKQTGISKDLILKWVNRADLYRVKGIGSEYSDLLEAAGVDTVVELAQRNPEALYKKLEEVNAEKKLVRRMPTPAQVTEWVESARQLPRAVHY